MKKEEYRPDKNGNYPPLPPPLYHIVLHPSFLDQLEVTQAKVIRLLAMGGTITTIAWRLEISEGYTRNLLTEIGEVIRSLSIDDQEMHRSGWMMFLIKEGYAHVEPITGKETDEPVKEKPKWFELLRRDL